MKGKLAVRFSVGGGKVHEPGTVVEVTDEQLVGFTEEQKAALFEPGSVDTGGNVAAKEEAPAAVAPVTPPVGPHDSPPLPGKYRGTEPAKGAKDTELLTRKG